MAETPTRTWHGIPLDPTKKQGRRNKGTLATWRTIKREEAIDRQWAYDEKMGRHKKAEALPVLSEPGAVIKVQRKKPHKTDKRAQASHKPSGLGGEMLEKVL